MFIDELDFFIENQEDFVEKYNGKVLIIKGKELIGVYEDTLSAYVGALKDHNLELGTFMIQPCISGKDAYTVTIAHQYGE